MQRTLLLAILASALMACEGETKTIYPQIDIPMGVKPGTRLSPKLLLADDGAMFLHHSIWVDSEYSECVFRNAADGKFRCLPNGTLQNEPLFLDVGCTQRAYHQPVNSCPASDTVLVRTKTPELCDLEGRWSVFPVKETIAVGQLFRLDGPDCISAGYIDTPNKGSIVVLDKEISADEFVSAWR
jgi:hypothetical protein